MPSDDSVLELPTRRRVFRQIVDHPGMYLRELQRALAMPMGALEYHLGQLEHAGLVAVVHEENKRFFPASIDASEKRALALMRQRPARRVMIQLLEQGELTRGGLLARSELPPSTLSYYLAKLVDAGLVERRPLGRENHYSLTDAQRTYRLLVRYRVTLVDRVLDGFLASFDSLGIGGSNPEK